MPRRSSLMMYCTYWEVSRVAGVPEVFRKFSSSRRKVFEGATGETVESRGGEVCIRSIEKAREVEERTQGR